MQAIGRFDVVMQINAIAQIASHRSEINFALIAARALDNQMRRHPRIGRALVSPGDLQQ